jgi:hypothetical protein
MASRRVLILVLVLGAFVACGGNSLPASPTPTTHMLSGTVTDSATGAGIAGATVTVQDGPNANRFASTDGSGRYTLPDLQQGGFTARATARYYNGFSKSVTLAGNLVANYSLAPRPLWTASGVGNSVFDMPTDVQRVHITGHHDGRPAEFIVQIAGEHIVSAMLGAGWLTDFSRTYVTQGGSVDIFNSPYVQWTFTEVRP